MEFLDREEFMLDNFNSNTELWNYKPEKREYE